MGAQPEPTQRVGGFQTQQPAADHDTHRRTPGVAGRQRVGADRVEVVECAVDVARRKIASRHRRHEGVRAGRQHQRVVADLGAVIGGHRLGCRVDPDHPASEPDVDAIVARIVIARQREPGPVPVIGVAGEPDAVVSRVQFLGQDGDPPPAFGVAGAQRFDEPVTDHAVADDHDVRD
jgi:hypothetical protein